METRVLYNNHKYTLDVDENVLDCLLRNGERIPYSCKVGVCQACMMKAVNGKVPARAQYGLKDNFKQQNYFLSCQNYPESDVTVQLPDEVGLSVRSEIIHISLFNKTIMCLRLLPSSEFEYQPGQYVTMTNSEEVIRSYSIANKLSKDGYIELHIRMIPDGKMSKWLMQYAKVGDEVVIRGPAGDCFYIGGENNSYPITLAGTGTGLAPLYGIVMEALEQGHKGEINLYHGAMHADDLYFVEELTRVAGEHPNFNYIPCVMHGEEGSFYQLGHLAEIVLNKVKEQLSDVRLYLCGAQEMVNSIKTKAFISGVSPKRIYSDAFLPGKDNERAIKERRSTIRPKS